MLMFLLGFCVGAVVIAASVYAWIVFNMTDMWGG